MTSDAVVGLVAHPVSLEHDAGPSHPERRDRVEAIETHLARTGLSGRLVRCEPAEAARDMLELAHEGSYLDRLDALDAAGGGRLDADTRMGRASLEAARRGSQGAVTAAESVLDGTWDAALVLMRPPGHHATADRAMGFCLTNHVAVAAAWAVRSGAAQRVAVIDWDAHHGNGTQDIFWTDPDVLYVSLHQYPWYPGSGDPSEVGDGDGFGRTLNVALPAGTGADAYLRAIDEVVAPEVDAFAPDLVLVSAGYDAHERDPLCMMRLRAGTFFTLARRIARLGRGPVCVLEGGYDLDALAWSFGATASALLGDERAAGLAESELETPPGTPDADRWIDHAAEVRGRL